LAKHSHYYNKGAYLFYYLPASFEINLGKTALSNLARISVSIPFIDLNQQYLMNKASIDSAVNKVLSHGQYIMGPEVRELEAELSEYLGVKHTLACSSGTDALVLPLMCKKFQSSDAIFTSPFTFFASAESISLTGATPVFVDIDSETYNIDPEKLRGSIEKIIEQGKLTPRGIIPVDLFGLAADYKAINEIAREFGLFVLEDAAQSFGANYHGEKAGNLADVGATSFYPAKPLGCYGDGGAVFTNDSEIYEEMVSLRVHGQATSGDKYDNVRIGVNARMDTIQAAVLLEKLKLYDSELSRRNQVADSYTDKLKDIVKTPVTPEGQSSVWAQYSVQSDEREKIRQSLSEKGIPTAVFYPIPIHLSTAYKFLGHKAGDFPISEAISNRIFSLPMHPYLEEADIKLIADTIASVV
jgi:UDP-2-acetamido-2-deoxy-ribo-hexuluronate aminotransferase